MLQILSLYFALRYCFACEKKKELIFSKLRMEVLETFFERLDPRSSIVSRMNSPWGLQRQKKHFNVIFHLAV